MLNMLKKSLRLGRKDLDVFFKRKSVFTSGRLVNLRYINNDLKTTRFAFVVSFSGDQPQKGRAVLRNLVRRRMSEVVRLIFKKIPPGRDVVLFLKLKTRKPPKYEELKEDIFYVLHKPGLSRSFL